MRFWTIIAVFDWFLWRALWPTAIAVLAGSGASDAGTPTPPVDLGTTLVAIKFDGGVVVGADTRTSQGTMVSHRYAHKIVPITSTVVIARSGSAADTQQLAETARWFGEMESIKYGSVLTVSSAAHFLRYQVYGEHGGVGLVSLLVAGFDDKPRIYSISQSGVLLEEQGVFAVSGSGSTFIVGHLDHVLRDCKTLDEEGAIELCQQSIRLAAHRDGNSGGLIRLHVINSKGRREVTVFPYDQEGPKALPGFVSATMPMKRKKLESIELGRDYRL